jgi:hypothetical protein
MRLVAALWDNSLDADAIRKILDDLQAGRS